MTAPSLTREQAQILVRWLGLYDEATDADAILQDADHMLYKSACLAVIAIAEAEE